MKKLMMYKQKNKRKGELGCIAWVYYTSLSLGELVDLSPQVSASGHVCEDRQGIHHPKFGRAAALLLRFIGLPCQDHRQDRRDEHQNESHRAHLQSNLYKQQVLVVIDYKFTITRPNLQHRERNANAFGLWISCAQSDLAIYPLSLTFLISQLLSQICLLLLLLTKSNVFSLGLQFSISDNDLRPNISIILDWAKNTILIAPKSIFGPFVRPNN